MVGVAHACVLADHAAGADMYAVMCYQVDTVGNDDVVTDDDLAVSLRFEVNGAVKEKVTSQYQAPGTMDLSRAQDHHRWVERRVDCAQSDKGPKALQGLLNRLRQPGEWDEGA